jgi:hypothetical protein
MSLPLRIFLFSLPINHVFAITTFRPDVMLPNYTVNIVSAPNMRSTYDILWSSLFTLIICVWSVQHLNVPKPTPDCTTWREYLQEGIAQGWSRVKWMLATLIFPEFLAGKAFHDLLWARKYYYHMKELAERDNVSWTLTHVFFADMGGFVIEVQPSLAPTELQHSVHKSSHEDASTLLGKDDETIPRRHDPSSKSSGGFNSSAECQCDTTIQDMQQSETLRSTKSRPDFEYAYPNAAFLMTMRQDGLLQRLPDVSLKAIQDKSKGDIFVKGIALIQVLWLIIQVSTRAIRNLPVSQLEISVLAFSACAVFTYVLSWAKPQDVSVPIILERRDKGITWESLTALNSQHRHDVHAWMAETAVLWMVKKLKLIRSPKEFEFLRDPIPNDGVYKASNLRDSYDHFGIAVAGVLFGALHCSAWDFYFPSMVDSLLWKLSSIISTIVPLYFVALVFVVNDKKRFMELARTLLVAVWVLAIVFYIIARLILIALVFRCFFYLPINAFVSTWTTEVPHV